MEIEAGTIQKLQDIIRAADNAELTKTLTLEYEGTPYTYEFRTYPEGDGRRLAEVIEPFRPATLEVSTLTGFVDAIRVGVCGAIDSNTIIQVIDYLTVAVEHTRCNRYGKRRTRLRRASSATQAPSCMPVGVSTATRSI